MLTILGFQKLKGKIYYMKTRDERVWLIQCLPDSSKGLNKDFLIVSGEWHDGVPCPTVEGEPGGVYRERKGADPLCHFNLMWFGY